MNLVSEHRVIFAGEIQRSKRFPAFFQARAADKAFREAVLLVKK
jgi:hypothetical protein